MPADQAPYRPTSRDFAEKFERLLALTFQVVERGLYCVALCLTGAFLRTHGASNEAWLGTLLLLSSFVLLGSAGISAAARVRHERAPIFLRLLAGLFLIILVTGVFSVAVRRDDVYQELARSVARRTPDKR